MAERRKTPRGRSLKGAKIVFNRQFSVIDCLVRNLTSEGALLKVSSTAGISDRFDLRFSQERTTRACRVEWRRDDQLGVSFV